MSRKLLISGLVAVLAFSGSAPVFARGEHEPETTDDHSTATTATRMVEDSMHKSDDTVKTVENSVEHEKNQRETIEAKKTELKDELKQMRQDNRQKLDGQRLAQCQNRQKQINQLIDRSVSNGKERLERVQRFEAGVRAFYEKKSLSSDQYEAASQNVDTKEAAAIAALDVMADENFDCTNIDGAKPSSAIQSTKEAKRKALDEYRESVRGLIKVVKAAFAATQSSATTEAQS